MNATDGTGRTLLGIGGDPDWQPIGPPSDSEPPDTSVTDGPDDLTNDATPTFAFGGFDDVTEGADLLFSHRVDVASGPGTRPRRASPSRASPTALTPST